MCTGTHPYIPALKTARSRMSYTQEGQTLQNVFYFTKDTPFSAADLASLNSAIVTAWTSHFKPYQPTSLILDTIESTALDTDSGAQVTLAVGETGLGAAEPMPTGVTVAVKFATGLIGRSQRGRMYWIGLCDNQRLGNQVTLAFHDNLLNAVQTFFGDIGIATSMLHAVVSYCTGKAWRITAQVTPVTDYILTDSNLDSQRRRLTGRGA